MELQWRGKTYEFQPRTLIAEKDKNRENNISANIYGFDTESSQLSDRYEPICFQTSSAEIGESLVWLPERADGLKAFLDFFVKTFSWIEFDSVNGRHCFLYAHNLMYDFQQLIKYRPDLISIVKTGIGLDHDYTVYSGDYYCILRRRGLFTGTAPHFSLKVGFSAREWTNIHFRDTFSFFPASLDKLGKTLKLPALKLEHPAGLGKIDYRKLDAADPERVSFEAYAKRDPLTTRLAGEQIRVLHQNAGMQRIRVSAPGFAINSLFHMIPEGTEVRTGSYESTIMQMVLDAYAGGRTGGIYHGRVEDMAVLDIHSSYPASFLTLPSFLPTMEYCRHPEPEQLTESELLEILDECHCFVKVSGTETDSQYPTILHSVRGKLVPVFGDFEELTVTGIELSVGIKSGTLHISKIHDLILLIEMEEPACYPFRVFAEQSYQAKAEAEKDSPEYVAAKLRLNSSSGKLIESRTETPVADDVANIMLPFVRGMETEFAKMWYEEYIKSLNENSEESFDEIYPRMVEEIFTQFDESEIVSTDFGSMSLIKLEYGRYAIPAAAALTTGTSRARLLVAMKAARAWYWDTDSIFVHNFNIENIREQFARASAWLPAFIQPITVGDKLGEMGIEIEHASGYLAGTKRYFIANDIYYSCIDRSRCKDCLQKKQCHYKKAIHGIPTLPYDLAAAAIEELATGNNMSYEGKARPQTVKQADRPEDIGKFTTGKYESKFHLDERLLWETVDGGWFGNVIPFEKLTRVPDPKQPTMNSSDDPVIAIVFEYHGLKPEANGAYKEELSDFRFPYRNFRSGSSIDEVVTVVNERLNKNLTANELLEYIRDFIRSQKQKNEPYTQTTILSDLPF
jgi:hypothetical protein